MKRLITLIFLLSLGHTLLGQDRLGLSISNYGGLYRTSYNPSTLGGSPYKWQLNVGTIHSTISTRYFQFFGRNSILYPSLASHSSHQLYGRSRTMGSITDQNQIYLSSIFHLPSLMISLGKKQGIALQVRNRGIVLGSGIPDDVKMLYTKRLDTPKPLPGSGDWGPFQLKQHSFLEASLSYGVMVWDNSQHKLKVGGTLKYITGGRTSFIDGTANGYEYGEISASGENQLIIDDLQYRGGYTTPVSSQKDYLNSDKYGQGIGLDLGVTWEIGSHWYIQDEGDSRPGYVLRLAGSVTDLGKINYRTSNSSRFTGQESSLVLQQKEMETITNFGPDGLKMLTGGTETDILQGRGYLPAMLHLEADVQTFKAFFIHTAYGKSLNNSESLLSMTTPGYFTLAPRWENEDSDYSFPITFWEGKKKATIGFTGRVGPFHIGFSNIAAILGLGDSKATYGYLGLSLFHMKTRDYRKKIKWKPEWKR